LSMEDCHLLQKMLGSNKCPTVESFRILLGHISTFYIPRITIVTETEQERIGDFCLCNNIRLYLIISEL